MIHPRAFAVWFRDLKRWNPGSFVRTTWQWPQDYIKPLSHALKAKQMEVNCDLAGLHMITLGFDGDIAERTGKGIESVKGKLYLANAGDVVFSKIDVRNGAIGIVPDSMSAVAVTSEFPVYRVQQEHAIPLYIKLLLRTDFLRKTINGMISGTSGRKRVQPSQLVSVEVPLPPLSIQKVIINRWQQSQSEIAATQREAEEIEQNAERQFLQGLGLRPPTPITSSKFYVLQWRDIARWGVGVNRPAHNIDVSTSHFPVHTLGELIADLENGWSPQCQARRAMPEEWGVLKLGAVSFGIFDQEENKALPVTLQPIPRYEVKTGDLLISRANITRYVGACALVKRTRPRLMLCDKIFRVVWKEHSDILPEYLDEVMKIPHLRHQIENALTGSSPTMKNISKPALQALRIPLPPRGEQQRLIDQIGKQRQRASKIRARLAEQQSRIKTEIESMILGKTKIELQ